MLCLIDKFASAKPWHEHCTCHQKHDSDAEQNLTFGSQRQTQIHRWKLSTSEQCRTGHAATSPKDLHGIDLAGILPTSGTPVYTRCVSPECFEIKVRPGIW